jgi:hypothetical protein
VAGTLDFSERRFWGPATWIFVGVLRRALPYLQGSLLAQRIDEGTQEGRGFYISLEGVARDEIRAFLAALERGYVDVESAGAQSFHDPEFYPRFMAEFRSLLEVVRAHLVEMDGGGDPA